MSKYFKSIIILLVAIQYCHAANILFYQIVASKSHKISMFPLAKALSLKGHNVTYISKFDPLEKIEGLKEINPTGQVEGMKEDMFDANSFMERVNKKFVDTVMYKLPMMIDYICEDFLSSVEFQILKSPEANGGSRFDMVIIDPAFNECILGLAHVHNSITLHFTTSGFYHITPDPTDGPSYVPYRGALILHYPDNTKFLHRLLAIIESTAFYIYRHYVTFPKYNKLFEKYHGPGIPDVGELERKISLTFLNTHFAVDMPMPHTPSVIEIGCLHCKPSKNVTDQKLKQFLDGSDENGFILFSLGSFVTETQMPEIYQQKFLDTFKRLKQRVLWKWDGKNLEGKIPSNVMLSDWLPQNDILGHPKIRLFISHGGKLGTEETVYHGVPVIVVPLIFDQELHALLAINRGYGKKFDPSDLLEGDVLYDTITEVLNNYTSYRSNALKYSSILKDQLNDPLETVVYWTEYLLRYNGAPHLQSNVKEFTYIQYYLLDIYALFICIILVFVYLVYVVLRFILKMFVSQKKYKDE